jgi:hypothetical protein
MKPIALIMFLQLAAILTAAEAPRVSPDIATEFKNPAILDLDQIRVVKELALRAGLPSVARIFTYNIHPGPSFGIGVVSKEIVSGRESRTRTLLIGYEKWEPGGSENQKIKFRSGEFWAYPWIDRSRFARFSGAHGEKKISLSERTPLAVADRIFALFESGKLRFKNPELKREVDLHRTAELALTGISWEAGERGSLEIAANGPTVSITFDCVLEEEQIVVIDVLTCVS